MKKSESDWNLSALDSPRAAVDVLGRGVLASTIARGLARTRADESLITGVYGPWGSGKTWLKHRILQEIAEQKEKITIVEFSPWQIRGVDELTIQFFAQVHQRLASGAKSGVGGKLAKREKMWMALARLSGAGSAALKVIGGAAALSGQGQAFAPALIAASGVSKHFAELLQSAAADVHTKGEKSHSPINAEEARSELAKLFSEPGVPSLLVVMDDFDRLTSDEIQAFVRLIKANANFSGLNYLILCDPDQLAAALDPISANKGKDFLEKIVQNPIRLPAPDGNAILRQLAAGLDDIARRIDYPLDQHLDRLRAYFQRFLRLRLKNLRSVYRLLEALEFSAAALTRSDRLEVDLLDLVVVDFLRLYIPALADWLQETRPSSYLFTGLRGLFDEEKKQPLKDLLPGAVTQSFGVENSYVILRTLFPELAREFPTEEAVFQASASSLGKISTDYPLALSSEEHFDAYFLLQPNAQKIPEAAYAAAFAGAWDRLQLKTDLTQWISEGWLPSALRRLNAEKSTFSKAQRTSLFLALADCSDLLGRRDDPGSFEGELRAAMHLLYDLLEGLSQQERNNVIDEVFATVEAITTRLLLLEDLRIRSAPELWEQREPHNELPVLQADKLDRLRAQLAPVASENIKGQSYFDHPQQGFRLWRWANALGVEYTEAFLRGCLERGDLDLILMIVRNIARSLVGRYDMSFEVAASYAGSKSTGVFKELSRFASPEFWRELLSACSEKFPPTETPENGDACLLQHLRRSLASDGGEET